MLNFLRKLFGGRAALHASEERFRLMVEGVKDYAIFMLDLQGNVITWNEGAQRLKGYLAQEIIGRHFSTFYPPEAIARGWPAEELRRATADGRIEDEGWRVRKDGSHFWANVVITALRDETGTLRGFGKVTRDLTERRQAEENARRLLQEEAARKAAEGAAREIERQREQLRVTLASIGDAVIVTDAQGQVTFLNPVAAGLTGWPAQEAAGQPLERVFPIINEESRQPVENPVRRAFRDKMVVQLANHTTLLARDGREVPIEDSAAPIRGAAGDEIGGAVLVFRDVSLRKLEERRKDEFLALLAHELRNPLAPLRNGLHLLRLAEGDPRVLGPTRAMMERQLAHLVRLVDDLLDVSRISRGKLTLRKERLSVADVVANALEVCGSVVKDQGHSLEVTLPETPLYLDADKTRLAQALCNLLSNAAKYSEPGSHVTLAAAREDGMAVLRVKDTGFGIPAAALPRVFDLFWQVDRTLEKARGGLGVGLTIVKWLVELHGGTVEAHSAGPGQGSEFVLRLPLAPSPPAAEPDGDTAAATSGARRRILVADDNVDAATSLALMLRLLGHEVRIAHDGLEAVAAATAFQPEVIFLDIGMPKLNGYDTCRRLREQPGLREALIVALTGWGQDEDKRRSHEAGFDRHLVKPVEPAALESLLAERQTPTGGEAS